MYKWLKKLLQAKQFKQPRERSEEYYYYYNKVKTAVERDELEKLFLGAPEYHIPWSRWDMYDNGVKTNLEYLYNLLLDYQTENRSSRLLDKLWRVLKELCHQATPETLYTVAYFIWSEADIRRHYPDQAMFRNLDIDNIAHYLSNRIALKKKELMQERQNFGGESFEDGVYGELKLLSKLSHEKGGPEFV